MTEATKLAKELMERRRLVNLSAAQISYIEYLAFKELKQRQKEGVTKDNAFDLQTAMIIMQTMKEALYEGDNPLITEEERETMRKDIEEE